MPSYGVQFVEGTSSRAGEGFGFTGLRGQLSLKASAGLKPTWPRTGKSWPGEK